jgi:hypothetical protein
MSFKKLIVSGVAAAALATGAMGAVGPTGTAADIVVAADKTGDFLLFPQWFANSAGWKTDLRVVNTNTEYSVIAKVVIREGVNSIELRDFMLYLTPGDVWEGEMFMDEDGKVKIHTADDSFILGDTTAAELDGGYTISMDPRYANITEDEEALYGVASPGPDTANGAILSDLTKGYIEVFGIARSDASNEWTLPDTLGGATYEDNLGDAPVNKHALYAALLSPDYIAEEWEAVGADDLTGQAVIYADNANGKLAMTSTATAFEYFMGDFVPADYNAVTSQIVAINTALANHTAYAACDAIDGVENALAKTENYVIHYGDDTIDESNFYATFDMKYYRLQQGPSSCYVDEIFVPKPEAVALNTYAWSSQTYAVYTGMPRDMMENTPQTPTGEMIELSPPPEEIPTTVKYCDTELCKIEVENSMGAEGYVTYRIQGMNNKSDMPYDTRLLTAKNIGGTNVTNIIQPAFKD